MRRTLLLLTVLILIAVPTSAFADHTPSFSIFLKNLNTGEDAGSFPYARDLPSGAGWLSGDRIAYRCAFTFLEYQDELVFRVTFVRIAGYTMINDRYMHEGVFDWYGNPGNGTQTDYCPPTQPYTPLQGDPGPRPVITIAQGGKTLEVRNYNNVQADPDTQFKIVSETPDRVTVVIYQHGQPLVAVYYDRLSDAVSLTTNQSPAPTGC